MTASPWPLVYRICLALALASLAALGLIDQHLKTAASPLGVVSFELCAYTDTCGAIVAGWVGNARLMGAMSLGLDYLFMATYPAAICLGLLLAVPRLPAHWRRAGTVLAWGVWLAGAADAVENFALCQMLLGQPVAAFQWTATVAATVKFVVLMPALLAWLGAMACTRQSKGTR
jgi:hypothetical protein